MRCPTEDQRHEPAGTDPDGPPPTPADQQPIGAALNEINSWVDATCGSQRLDLTSTAVLSVRRRLR